MQLRGCDILKSLPDTAKRVSKMAASDCALSVGRQDSAGNRTLPRSVRAPKLPMRRNAAIGFSKPF